jgi:hypothetical protein
MVSSNDEPNDSTPVFAMDVEFAGPYMAVKVVAASHRRVQLMAPNAASFPGTTRS